MSLPAWVEITTALLTPAIAVVGSVLAWQNHQLAKRRRKDELFDRRYAFYQRVRDWWLQTGEEDSREPDGEDIEPIAEEAEFLFGQDIAKHLRSLENQHHTGSPFFPNSSFTKPFTKYLRLEEG